MCGRSGVDVLTVGVWPFWLWPFWSVAVLNCYRSQTDECRLYLEYRWLDMRTGANMSPSVIYIKTVLLRTLGAVLPPGYESTVKRSRQ